MTNTEIYLLHRKLYEYLKTLHEANPHFLFWILDSSKGLWFKHTIYIGDSVIYTMFEEGFKNYSLRVLYNGHPQQWSCHIQISIQSKSLSAVLESLHFVCSEDKWHKKFASSNDFLAPLKNFIQNEKPLIEAVLKKQLISTTSLHLFKQQIEQIDQFYQRSYIREYHRLIAENSKINLPFAISRLEIFDFQGITHLIMDKLPTEKQWIFLTGENGFGKTSILKAITKGLAGDEDFVASLPKETRLTINGYHWNEPFFCKAASKQILNPDFQVAAYGASRFQVSKIDASEFSTSKYGKKTYSLFNDDGLLMNLDRFLMDAERDDLPTFERLKAIFLKIIPNLADIKSVVAQKNRRMVYYEKTDVGDSYAPVYLSELAAGYRGILTLIGDMVQRLTAHPDNSLDELQGVVIIDEFDAHLHPKYQYQLPQLLSEVFPKVQFIVATHSPIPILGAKPNTFVVLTVHRTKSEGITMERLDDDIDIQKLSVNALLTSDIFDFGTIFANGATPDTLESFDNYKDIQEKDRLKKLLQLKNVFNRLK